MRPKGEIPCKVRGRNFLAASGGGISDLWTICGVWLGGEGVDRARAEVRAVSV